MIPPDLWFLYRAADALMCAMSVLFWAGLGLITVERLVALLAG